MTDPEWDERDDRSAPAASCLASVLGTRCGQSCGSGTLRFVSCEPPDVTLTAFTRDLLQAVQPWFRNEAVRHRLGGPEWPERELTLMAVMPGQEYRGRRVLRAHSWVVLDQAGTPVAKVGGDVYDRWCRYDGSRADRPVVSHVEPGPAMGLSYVVDPLRWGQGFGRAALDAVLRHADVADVRVFAAGIDADNQASRRCAASAGFVPDVSQPDWEDTIHYLLRR